VKPAMLFPAFAAASAALLLAASAGCSREPAEAARPIRVASCNVRVPVDEPPNDWASRKDALAGLLLKMDIDAGGLQEAVPGQVAFLKAKMPGYAFYGDYRNADRKTGEASCIFYRTNRFEEVRGGNFWLSETPDVPGSVGWDAMCIRICTWLVLREKATGSEFCFVNTHTDHKGPLARKNGMRLILERMEGFAGKLPVVFTGDHNCSENSEPAMLVSERLDNALYTTQTPPKGPWRTFNGWRWLKEEYPAAAAVKFPVEVRNRTPFPPAADGAPALPSGPRGDYIYVSRGVKVLEFATHGDPRPGTELYPTDHYPVSASIVLPRQSAPGNCGIIESERNQEEMP